MYDYQFTTAASRADVVSQRRANQDVISVARRVSGRIATRQRVVYSALKSRTVQAYTATQQCCLLLER